MKKRLRALSLVVSLVLSVLLFAGCGPNKTGSVEGTAKEGTAKAEAAQSSVPKEPITLKMWGGVPPESGPQKACDNFNNEFKDKGIQVEYERFVNDEQGNLKLETNLMAGSDIDIYVTYAVDRLKKRATGNMAFQLDDLLKRDKLDIVGDYGELVEAFLIDGKNYCIPTNKAQTGFLINKDMFDAAGIPVPKSWTLDEFREISKKLTKGEGENKIYGSYLNTPQYKGVPFDFYKASIGNDPFFKPGGKETRFDDPLIEKSYQTVVDMMNVDKSMPTHVDAVTEKMTPEGLFLSGKTAIVSGTYLLRNVKDREKFPHKFKTAFAPTPQIVKGKYYSSGSLGDLICINSKSKHIEDAWTFVKWYAEKGMAPLAAGGRVPANKKFDPESILKEVVTGYEDLVDGSSYKDVMITSAEGYSLNLITDNLAEINKVVEEESEAIYAGKYSVKEGLATIKKRADDIIAKNSK